MSILTKLFSWIVSDFWTTILTIFIAYMVYKLAKFYYRYYSLPPGPFPLPVFGNILEFKSKLHWNEVMRELAKKYGPVFTVHMGNTPQVVISDADIGREAFRRNDFAGRPTSFISSTLSNDKFSDIVSADYGHQWEALRRVAHAAVQKYSNNERLVNVAVDSVDNTIKSIVDSEGTDKPFIPEVYIYLMFLNILANSTFGENYTVNDPEFKQIKYIVRDFTQEMGTRFMFWEISPLFRWIDNKMVSKHKSLLADVFDLMEKKLQKHYKDYNPSIERDFCDALIAAKNDALREGKESAPYLTDANLRMCIFDLFVAGTDTSFMTFHWILLFMTYYPSMQTMLRQEIDTQIGDRLPTHEDRHRCHYVMAFISETLRLRNVVPVGLMHKAMVNSKIANYTIPKDMSVVTYQSIILRDNKHWDKCDDFIPERFLDSDGKYMTTRSPAFIPFGVGRRVCLGEKLAIADLFLVLARFLQSTQNYDIVLDTNKGIQPDPSKTMGIIPEEYKIVFKTKSR